MSRNRKIIATTTSTIEGFDVVAYLGVVSAHVVAGTGLFSDLAASLSDLFGGRSRSYQKQLASIHDEAIELLQDKVAAAGGNCVLSVRLDHDEISGGGKSMFMVTATGTAAKVSASATPRAVAKNPILVSAVDLATRMRRRRLLEVADAGSLRFNDETWEFMCSYQVVELAPTVLARVEKLNEQYWTPEAEEFTGNSEIYFRSLAPEETAEYLYPVLKEGDPRMSHYALGLLSDLNLLDLDEATSMLQAGDFEVQKRALQLLQTDKASYAAGDLAKLEEAKTLIASGFGKRGRVVDVDRTFSSKTDQRWECECGTRKNVMNEYCPKCLRDIFGFLKEDTRPDEIVRLISAKIEIIEHELEIGNKR